MVWAERLRWMGPLALFFVAAFALSSSDTVKGKAQILVALMKENELLGAGAYIAVSIVVSVFGLPIPFHDYAVSLVYSFPTALALIFTGKTIGSACCYIAARNFLGPERKASLMSNDTVKKVNGLIASSPIYFGTLLRLATIPTAVKNYGLAFMDVSLTQYLICCMIGSSIFVPIQTYIGSKMGAFSLGLTNDPGELGGEAAIFVVVGLVCLLLVVRAVVKALLAKADDPAAGAVPAKTDDTKTD